MQFTDTQLIEFIKTKGPYLLELSGTYVHGLYFSHSSGPYVGVHAFNRVWDRVTSLLHGGLYLVGGAVRDEIMGLPISDCDYVVTGQTPETMHKMGFNQVGAAFPVFLHPETGDEYALARTEIKTGAGYHGFTVEFGIETTIERDCGRRDLSINAIAKNALTGEIIDPFNGRQDIADGVIRCVSVETFKEDPLRVLRALRFAARYDMVIERYTLEAMKDVVGAGQLNELPYERFVAELQKVYKDTVRIEGGNPSASGVLVFWSLCKQIGVFEHVNFFKDLTNLTIGAARIAVSAYKQGVFAHYGLQDHETLFNVTMALNAAYSTDKYNGVIVDRFLSLASTAARFAVDLSTAMESISTEDSRADIAHTFTALLVKHRLHQVEDKRDVINFIDMLMAVATLATTRQKQCTNTLMHMAKILSSVKAADCGDLTGKALGQAIFDKRVELVAEYLDTAP